MVQSCQSWMVPCCIVSVFFTLILSTHNHSNKGKKSVIQILAMNSITNFLSAFQIPFDYLTQVCPLFECSDPLCIESCNLSNTVRVNWYLVHPMLLRHIWQKQCDQREADEVSLPKCLNRCPKWSPKIKYSNHLNTRQVLVWFSNGWKV